MRTNGTSAGSNSAAGGGADALVPTGVFRHLDTWLAHPAWLRAGTALGPGMLPLFVSLADALLIVENVVKHGQAEPVLRLMLRHSPTTANPVSASLLDHAPDLQAGLTAMARYVNVTHSHLLMTCDHDDSQVRCAMRGRVPMSLPAFGLLGAMAALTFIRYSQRYGLTEANFESVTVPGHAALLSELLGISAAERPTEAVRLIIRAERGRYLNPGHDPQLWQLAKDRLGDLEQRFRHPDLVQRLEELISSRLANRGRVPNLADAARAIGMSERTLSRRLGDLDLGLRDIADKVRQRRARQLIAQPTLSIDEIASRLGYPDQSSFCRHFKTWFGCSPARFRREGEQRAAA